MNAPENASSTLLEPPDRALEARFARELKGEVLFDAFSRGRYATDASIYQIAPLGVVVPRDAEDALAALEIARDAGVPILPRGAGSSQCGQTVGKAVILDTSKYLNAIGELDPEARTLWVEPGTVLERLNARLAPLGLWYPVDVSTAAQATIGGMTANNSCGARSIRYGNMVHNVAAIDAWLSSGDLASFANVDAGEPTGPARYREIVRRIRSIAARERDEITARVPRVQRRVAGYNLDQATGESFNMAKLLVGSEGTLAYFRRIKLQLAALPAQRVLGVVQFPSFYQAMDSARHIVELGPSAVELVDRKMIELARAITVFRATLDGLVRGDPEALLLVEFAGDDRAAERRKLERLIELMADRGLPASVAAIEEPARQQAIWEVRKAGLNIMMSMKGDAKPVSFIEDCAVPLEHLAEYTRRLNDVFAKHGTEGTFYAHASVGCLHVRPVLDMRNAKGALKMRAIAEEACALVRELKGSYSGEHGDGLVRSEWIAPVYGPRLARAFTEIKHLFDPAGLMNPGKIVAAPQMDDRRLFRYMPGYATPPVGAALDWSDHEAGPGNRGRGFAAAVEMCNNNGACRKLGTGAMCPSYRVTRDEQHVTRGRANVLRLALSGQLGKDALSSEAMHEAMALCVSCKACRRECPTGVDMAAMKIEFLHQYHRRHRRPWRDRLIAHLPRYAPWAARLAPLTNWPAQVPGVGDAAKKLLGFAAQRPLPVWRRDYFRAAAAPPGGRGERVVLFADTFNRYFEPANLRAAAAVLAAAGYRVEAAEPRGRALCCGRSYLAVGMVEQARREARRLLTSLGGFAADGVPIVGLEPACLMTLRDELQRLVPGGEAAALGRAALTFAEFVAAERRKGRFAPALREIPFRRALVHGHCHEKAFGAMDAVVETLRCVPGLRVEAIESSCCGMAGAFGYDARFTAVSRQMAEAALLPAVRAADEQTLIVADGTSCRQQIHGGTGREPRHVARVLADYALDTSSSIVR